MIGELSEKPSAIPKANFGTLPRSKSTGEVEETSTSTVLKSDSKSPRESTNTSLTINNDQETTNHGYNYTAHFQRIKVMIDNISARLSASPKLDFGTLSRTISTTKEEKSPGSSELNSDSKSHQESTGILHTAPIISNDQKATDRGDDHASHVERIKEIIDDLFAKLSAKPDSVTATSYKSADDKLTTLPSALNSESKTRTPINNSHNSVTSNLSRDEKLKKIGKDIASLQFPVELKCDACPDDKKFCCKSGCCGRLSFWMEPPAAYFWMAWLAAIVLILGLTIFPFANHKTTTGVLSVVFKDGVRTSASTCETTLSDEPERAEDVFDNESCQEPTPVPGWKGPTFPITENRFSDYVDYEHSLGYETTDETVCILDNDVRFKF
ncbi:hypothetical protein GE061_005815 [Apolygus lucorum]|uniref:Uncharacterized protein n=1 Tax=Apolygus lucorum TaxID=248454 RepID=A0A8S9WXB9_APOLU|nr:hypothetical protein GE061_005815 [Apolygus lucorum]